MADWLIGAVFAGVAVALAHWRGYELGVRHTEERWREAVARKEAR